MTKHNNVANCKICGKAFNDFDLENGVCFNCEEEPTKTDWDEDGSDTTQLDIRRLNGFDRLAR
jgi:hypothetical protein